MRTGIHVKYEIVMSDVKLNISLQSFEKFSNIMFNENTSRGETSCFLRTDSPI